MARAEMRMHRLLDIPKHIQTAETLTCSIYFLCSQEKVCAIENYWHSLHLELVLSATLQRTWLADNPVTKEIQF